MGGRGQGKSLVLERCLLALRGKAANIRIRAQRERNSVNANANASSDTGTDGNGHGSVTESESESQSNQPAANNYLLISAGEDVRGGGE